jgi:hypothetical protein
MDVGTVDESFPTERARFVDSGSARLLRLSSCGDVKQFLLRHRARWYLREQGQTGKYPTDSQFPIPNSHPIGRRRLGLLDRKEQIERMGCSVS